METSPTNATDPRPDEDKDREPDAQEEATVADEAAPPSQTPSNKRARATRAKDKEPARQSPAPARTDLAGLSLGRMVRFVVKPHGASEPPDLRLAIVTRVVNAKKGVIDCVVFPWPGDFHKNVDPGLYMGARNVAYHPGVNGEAPDDVLVPGTWCWPEST